MLKQRAKRSFLAVVLGYFAPWTTPLRVLWRSVRSSKDNSPVRDVVDEIHAPSWFPFGRKKTGAKKNKQLESASEAVEAAAQAGKAAVRRIDRKTVLIVVGLSGAVVAVVTMLRVQKSRSTPPPIAPAPPRVEDVPTAGR